MPLTSIYLIFFNLRRIRHSGFILPLQMRLYSTLFSFPGWRRSSLSRVIEIKPFSFADRWFRVKKNRSLPSNWGLYKGQDKLPDKVCLPFSFSPFLLFAFSVRFIVKKRVVFPQAGTFVWIT